MRIWLKRGYGVGFLLILAVVFGTVCQYPGERKRQRVVDVRTEGFPGPAMHPPWHGRYLFAHAGCADCHGVDGGGREFINDGKACACAGPISRRAELLATTPHRGLGTRCTPRGQVRRASRFHHAQ